MRDAGFGHSDTDTEFGRERLAGVQEALAYMRGEIDLPAASSTPCPPPA